MTLISAHRCGAEADRSRENTREALERALTLEAEYVEFDVQRCVDGIFVLFHDGHLTVDGTDRRVDQLTYAELSAATAQLVRYDEALAILAGGGKRAHIDLKFDSPDGVYDDPSATYEVEATAMALDVMGSGRFIVTSLEDRSVLAIRRWAKPVYPDLLVGLSLGRDISGGGFGELIRTRRAELFPRTRIRICDANLIVANKTLARLTLAGFAARRGLPLLVWTVDDDAELKRWIRDPRTWMVTTNFPAAAVQIRERRKKARWRGSLLQGSARDRVESSDQPPSDG